MLDRLPLISTKLSPPNPSAGEVPRERLVGFCDNFLGSTLVLITAPPGSGKTTLIGQWCRLIKSKDRRVCWVSLGKEESIERNFVDYLSHALLSLDLEWDKAFLELISKPKEVSLELLLVSLVNALNQLEEKVFIFLDDYHLVNSDKINKPLGAFLLLAPENVTLTISSRERVGLPLNKLRADGRLQEIGFDELRFNFLEACDYLKATSLNLTIRDVEQLLEVTEGWAVGLQLLCLSPAIRANPTNFIERFSGVNKNVKSYIEEIVLTALPENEIALLLRTSILDRLCGPLCEAVAGTANAAEILKDIQSKSMFVTGLDEEGYWYRYHHIFAAVLLNMLQTRYPNELQTLHARASQWFLDNNLLSEAVRHAIASERIENTIEIATQAAGSLADEGDLETLESWLQSIYVEDEHQRFHLGLIRVWALAHSLKLAEARALLKSIHSGIKESDITLSETEQAELHVVEGIVANISDDTAMGIMQMEPCAASLPIDRPWVVWLLCNALTFALTSASRYEDARKVYMLLPEQLERNPKSVFVSVYRKYVWSIYHKRQGSIDMAILLIKEGLALAEEKTGYHSNGAALAAGYLAGLLYEKDEFEQLERVLAGRLDVIKKTALLDPLRGAYLALSRVRRRQYLAPDADKLLEEMEHFGVVRNWPRLLASALYERLCLATRDNELADAEKLLEQMQGLLADVPEQRCALSEIKDLYQLAQIRVLLLKQDYQRAIEISTSEIREHRLLGNMTRALLSQLLYVQALALAGDEKAALKNLAQVLKNAEKAGLLRSVMDDIKPISLLFNKLVSEQPQIVSASYLAKMLEVCRTSISENNASQKPAAKRVSLSPREQDMLRLLRTGKVNKEIARELNLSLETVKWHLKNLYSKLGVANRLQAISQTDVLLTGDNPIHH